MTRLRGAGARAGAWAAFAGGFAILAGGPVGCGPGPDGGPDAGYAGPEPQVPRCTRTYTAFPSPAADLQDPELVESSGIAASSQSPEVLWIHNDSGDVARVFATGTDGAALGRLNLPAAEALDLEDIAIAACPDAATVPCLWLADTGDNARERDDVALYIVPEPSVPETGIGERQAASFSRVPLSYEGGPVDVEAVVVEADGGRVWLIEKVDEPAARVFAAEGPFRHGAAVEAALVTTLSSPGVGTVNNGLMITGADLHPSGRQLVLRVYTGVHEYRLDEGQSVESIGEVAPLLVTLGPFTEPQGEAVGYDSSGLGLWTVSEDVESMPGQPLHHYDCE